MSKHAERFATIATCLGERVPDERLTELAERYVSEATDELEWYWLSFASGALPKGEQFLGVAVVAAHHFMDAVALTHELGINPGGEVQGGRVPAPPIEYQGRLLTRAEAMNLDALYGEHHGKG